MAIHRSHIVITLLVPMFKHLYFMLAVVFTARRRASTPLAVVFLSVRPSLRLSVRLSHAGIVSKRINIESRKQRNAIAQGL